MATQDEINKVIESTDMVELVSPYVKLIKQGKSYKGLCPFHNEDTPSFVVSQEKHLAHCFGCGKGGNPIKFLMEIKQVSFNEALAELANKNGIKIDVNLPTKKGPDNTRFYQMMQLSSKFYEKNLTLTQTGKIALDYLYKRGLNDETIKMFKIGLSPANIDSLYKVLKESNYLELDMLDLGLIGKNDKGYYDLFTKRIMFPIADEFGNIIGFSARLYEDIKDQPKYINTKDTFLYRKGNILYNLNNAKTEMLRKKRVILHEGQMDVISAYNAGYKEAICTMGTALTIEQAYTIKKYASNAIICFDGDKAGINASKKAINIFKQVGMNVHLVLLPNKMDPDEFIKLNGKEAYQNYFESHIIDEIEYQFETMFMNQDLKDSIILENIKVEAFSIILNLSSQAIKEKYLSILANKLCVSLEAINTDYSKYSKTLPITNFVEDSYSDDIFNNNHNLELENVNKNVFKKYYELRLFLYARNSKEKALEIDNLISDHLNAFSPINRDIWITLINNYYMQYDVFDDSLFCELLTDEQKNTYLDNLESIRGNQDAYNDEDLNLIVDKMINDNLKEKNKILSLQINQTDDESEKIKKLAEKYKNKKNIMPYRRSKNGI